MPMLKIEPSEYMARLLEDVGSQMGRSRTAALENLLFRIEVIAKHGKLTELIGLEWIEAANILNANGLGARQEDPVLSSTGESLDLDVSVLERNSKSKSGFAGVYATTGATFRALVPDPVTGGSKYLASRKTAVQAAIDRYEWFNRFGLPYGNVGFHVEHWKRMRPEWSIDQILSHLLEDCGKSFGLKNPYTLEQIQQTIVARNRLKGKPSIEDEAKQRLERKSSDPTVDDNNPYVDVSEDPPPKDMTCTWCNGTIEAKSVNRTYSSSGVVHKHCPGPK